MPDRLRPLWDFDDLDATEQRLREQLEHEVDDRGRAEVVTQLARVEGLRSRFDEANALVDRAELLDASSVRVPLERGRIRRSGGDSAAALPLFETAFERAVESGDDVLAADAAHMAALVGDLRSWTARGVELAERSADPGARYWVGPLSNNLGWARLEAGDHSGALAAFERALEARELDLERPYEREIARYAVAKALLALDRPREAVALLEVAVAWAAGAGIEDAYFDEALAEARLAAASG